MKKGIEGSFVLQRPLQKVGVLKIRRYNLTTVRRERKMYQVVNKSISLVSLSSLIKHSHLSVPMTLVWLLGEFGFMQKPVHISL